LIASNNNWWQEMLRVQMLLTTDSHGTTYPSGTTKSIKYMKN
jgi:hypothetical protein